MSSHGEASTDAARESSPYLELDRSAWAALAGEVESPLSAEEIRQLRGLGDQLDLDEVQQIYLPVSKLLSLYVESAGRLYRRQEDFLHQGQPPRTPFVIDIKSGKDEVEAPVYSHLTYDITDEKVVVHRPDIVIVEGLNVLQPAGVRPDGKTGLAVSDFFDFTVYVDAAQGDIRHWYTDRFLRLRETAFRDPASYFAKYAGLSHDEAVDEAHRIWDSINGPNLNENVAPTRSRATLVLRKDRDHSVRYVRLRKL